MAALGGATSAAYDMLAEVPVSRWDADDAPGDLEATLTSRAHHGAFVGAPQLFDHANFSVSLAEAAAMDPQQRLVLDCSYAALHATGAGRSALLGSDTGVASSCTLVTCL